MMLDIQGSPKLVLERIVFPVGMEDDRPKGHNELILLTSLEYRDKVVFCSI
jgi:hypothetical protein